MGGPHKTSAKRDALGKALQVLWHIADVEGDVLIKEWGVRELGGALQLTPAAAHRTLTALARHGLVQHNPTSGQYQIGTEFFRLALKLTSHFGIRNVGIPVMRDLVEQCNETSFLGLYDRARMEVMFIAAVASSHPLRYVVPLNEWFPVYAGASGLAMGLGLDRLVMLRKGVEDIRLLRATDPRIAGQMLDLAPYRPVSNQPSIRRDLSIAVAAANTPEELGDRVRVALSERAGDVEAVEVLGEAPGETLPAQAAARLGIRRGQKNVLLRVVLRSPERTLTDGEANQLRDAVYAALHEGGVHQWASGTAPEGWSAS